MDPNDLSSKRLMKAAELVLHAADEINDLVRDLGDDHPHRHLALTMRDALDVSSLLAAEATCRIEDNVEPLLVILRGV